jgi:TolB-like protein
MEKRHHPVWHTVREYVTHWTIAGAILAVTGAAPEHWLAELWHEIPIPRESLPLWFAQIDYRLVAVIAGLSIVVGDTLWRHHRPQTVPETKPAPMIAETGKPEILALPDKPSIAVLPFANLSGDPGQEYFSDGITEDVTTALSRIRFLFVIAHNSAFAYKGKSPEVRQVGRELGVRYVLEGSVRKAGNRVRITGQLIDAATGTHIWDDRFDGDLADVFDLQDRVTASVAGAIEPAVLAEVAYVLGYFGEDITVVLRIIDRALDLNPNFAIGWMRSGWLRLWAGHQDLAIAHFENFVRFSPRESRAGVHLGIGVGHFFARRFEEARTMLLLSLGERSNWVPTHRFLAACYASMGRLDEARDAFTRVRELTSVPISSVTQWRKPEDRELFLSGLRLAAGEISPPAPRGL